MYNNTHFYYSNLQDRDDGAKQCMLAFCPVTDNWRLYWNDSLKLSLPTVDNTELAIFNTATSSAKTCSRFDRPIKCHPIRGDGNCFYRAIASWLSNFIDDNNYGKLRQLVLYQQFGFSLSIVIQTVEFIREHMEKFRWHSGMSEDDFDVHVAEQSCDTIWATDIEISAVATMLQVEIWTFVRVQ